MSDINLKDVLEELERLKAELDALKKTSCKKFDLNTPLGCLQELSDGVYKNSYESCVWKSSPLESLDKLKNDYSGKVGELFVESICKKSEIPHVYSGGDTNSKDGTYDIVIKEKKVEIKTAKLGKQKAFQHESLRLTGYDYILFLDVTPEDFYMTILPRFDLRNKSEILGKSAHLRKGSSDVFKLDFSEKLLTSLIEKGYTLKVTETTTIEDLNSFIQSKIS